MSVDLLRGELGEVPGLRLRPDEPMAQHTPLRVGGPAELWAVAEDIDALRLGIKAARRHRIPWRLHWPFQDWIVRDGVLAGLTVRPGRAFEGIERLALDRIRIHAASPWSSLAGLGSGWWDELSRWPGCPGGLLAEGQQARLTGMCREIAWYRARGTDRLDVEEGQTPPAQPPTAIPAWVDISPGLLIFDGVDGPCPPRAGRLFADPEVGGGRRRSVEAILREGAIPGARLRAWKLAIEEPGLVVNLGEGTARDLLLLAQGVAARIEKSRGIKIEIRIPFHGADRLSPRRPLKARR